ncbi:uncharacterized protein A4U43_C08F26630 [Asparagus officinalis]|nr:uncharacterized protein A4U43_C08F26630 [Asparagus officinalis]
MRSDKTMEKDYEFLPVDPNQPLSHRIVYRGIKSQLQERVRYNRCQEEARRNAGNRASNLHGRATYTGGSRNMCRAIEQLSVFNRLTNVVRPAKRQRRYKKKTVETEYPEVTINVIGRGKALGPSSEESQRSYSPTVREICDEFEGVYHHTRTRTGTIRSVNYQRLAKGIISDDEHSVIAES